MAETLEESKSIIDQIFEKTFNAIQESESFDKSTILALRELAKNTGFKNPDSIKKILHNQEDESK